MASDMEIPDDVQAAFTRLSESLDPGEISDLQAVRMFLVRQFNFLLYERAQLAKRQQSHSEFVRRLKTDLDSLSAISSKARTDVEWERV